MHELPEKFESPALDAPANPRPQFSLRSLLVAISLVSGIFGLLSVLPPVWSFMAIWVALLVFAHVAANAWGKRTFGPGASRPGDSGPAPATPRPLAMPAGSAPNSIRLRRQATLERSRYVATLVAAGVGGLTGCVVLALIHIHQASVAACAVWTGASAVICGIGGFIGSGLWQVVTRSPDELAPLP
ncbi:MAG: hypothetical protein AB7O68_18320 [Pirellulales bacterium]